MDVHFWYNSADKVCGESDTRCLVFHHRDASTKEYRMSELISSAKPLQIIKEEIVKCDVLCGNCHFEFHWGDKF